MRTMAKPSVPVILVDEFSTTLVLHNTSIGSLKSIGTAVPPFPIEEKIRIGFNTKPSNTRVLVLALVFFILVELGML